MTSAAWRMAGTILAVVLLLIIGGCAGVWLASKSYRPLLDKANSDLATATAGRNNLEELATDQGLKLGELVKLGQEREILAEKAQGEARVEAQPHYAAANRLLSDRTGGDQCAAATAVIDQELFGL